MASRTKPASAGARPTKPVKTADSDLGRTPKTPHGDLGNDQAINALSRLRPGDLALGRSFILNLRGGWRPKIGSEKSITTYAHALAHFARFIEGLGLVGLLPVTREHALEWMGQLRKERALATVEVYLGGVRLFYDWLVDEGEIKATAHPFQRIHTPKRSLPINEPLSADEIRRIFDSQSIKTLTGLRNRALFAVLLDTGLRLAEVAAMDVADLDWKFGHVKVTGKGAKERRVRMGSTTMAAVDRYLRARARVRDVPWLWDGRTGERLREAGISSLHSVLGAALDIHLHPHRFRHTNAQSLLSSGMDRESVRELLGHADLQTLRVYTRATDTERALEAHRKHSPMDNLKRQKRT